MSDTMSASSQWCQFDDEHKRQHGFRLPADPYWLAPPQGSIIALWHRGGAPNYQPKPMIARHLNDPIKCWSRERMPQRVNEPRTKTAELEGRAPKSSTDKLQKAENKIHIHFCSSGTTALKLAKRLRRNIEKIQDYGDRWYVCDVQDANSLDISEVRENDVILLVVSSCGRGEIPDNGKHLVTQLKNEMARNVPYAIFGNGDSNYRDTFNGAALRIQKVFDDGGAIPLLKNVFHGDNTAERPPWKMFEQWSSMVMQALCGDHPLIREDNCVNSVQVKPNTENWFKARLQIQQPRYKLGEYGIKRVKLLVDSSISYPWTGCISILVPNKNELVQRIRCSIGITDKTTLQLPGQPDFSDFVRHFVDLGRPFNNLKWASALNLEEDFTKSSEQLAIPEFFAKIPKGSLHLVDLTDMAVSMPASRPRRYSIASFQQPNVASDPSNGPEILVQMHRLGCFSDWYFNSYLHEGELLCKIEGNS